MKLQVWAPLGFYTDWRPETVICIWAVREVGGSDLFKVYPQINASSLVVLALGHCWLSNRLMLASVVQRSSADCYLAATLRVP